MGKHSMATEEMIPWLAGFSDKVPSVQTALEAGHSLSTALQLAMLEHIRTQAANGGVTVTIDESGELQLTYPHGQTETLVARTGTCGTCRAERAVSFLTWDGCDLCFPPPPPAPDSTPDGDAHARTFGCDCPNPGCTEEFGPQHVEMTDDEFHEFAYGLKPGQQP
ncbi:hypothetical protein CLV92_1256 [Kineococcus xinjiangensis]|uniref:Uncharacterized protein n=1 Tax=Kineococcus xinjiangensis TaxID=512762 RepID=A0A2S6IC51_9ACTN|nr:hypothetical protein [Kineococcus xinjiangensis]PPK90210.1 hypothetical protein CLV92_1256 [Kineococcus xinjiangensis]